MTGQRSTRTRDARVDDRARTRYEDDNDERYRDEDQYDDRDDDYDDRGFEQDDQQEAEYEDDGQAGATKLRDRPRRKSGLSAGDAARAAMQHIADLIDKPTLGVTAVKPSDDGWTVSIEVLDDSRIPSSADILALYDVDMDMAGTLLSYERMGRYTRGRGDTSRGG